MSSDQKASGRGELTTVLTVNPQDPRTWKTVEDLDEMCKMIEPPSDNWRVALRNALQKYRRCLTELDILNTNYVVQQKEIEDLRRRYADTLRNHQAQNQHPGLVKRREIYDGILEGRYPGDE